MAEQARLIDIYIMGKHYQVPEGLTILTALEYSGYRTDPRLRLPCRLLRRLRHHL